MKKIIQLVTTLAVLIIMSLSGAVVANATPADDVYNFASAYKNSKGQATPVRDAGLSQAAQSWANSLAKADKGTKDISNPDPFPVNSRPANATSFAQVPGSGASVAHAVEGAKNGNTGAAMINPIYNTVGVGSKVSETGVTYIVVNYAAVVTPPVPAPVVVPKPVPAPAPVVVPEPAPVVIPEPAPVEPRQPEPVVESPKPAPKATEKPKPTSTASSSPKPTETPEAIALPKRQLAKELAEERSIQIAENENRVSESERASKAELEAQETKAWQKQTVTKAGISLGGVGTLAFLLLPLTRQRKTDLDDEQSEPTVTLDDDDDDDDWNIGS